MAPRLLSIIGLALVAPSAGIRKSSRVEANVTSGCSALSNIVIGGKKWGQGIEIVCNRWPSGLGEFPLDDITRTRQLLEQAMGPGGTWDQIKEIRENRARRGFCWRNETLRVVSTTGRCEMTSRGVCYGSCPSGFQPGLLSGIFGPACTSDCRSSTHRRGCGFGCATNVGQCARTVLDQVSVVASGVGSVASFLTGNERIAEVVDAIVNFAEFLMSVLPMLVDAVKGGISAVTDRETGALAAIVLYQYIVEVAPEVGQTMQAIKEAFNQVADIIGDLAEERRETGNISVGHIVRTILDHGDHMLDFAVKITKAFTFSKCAVA
jgi:hypothetical protein